MFHWTGRRTAWKLCRTYKRYVAIGRNESLSTRPSLTTLQSELSGTQFRSSSRFVPQIVQMLPSVFAQHFKPYTTNINSAKTRNKVRYTSNIGVREVLISILPHPQLVDSVDPNCDAARSLSLSLCSRISKSLKSNEKPETGWFHYKFIHLIPNVFQKITVENINTAIILLNTSLRLCGFYVLNTASGKVQS